VHSLKLFDRMVDHENITGRINNPILFILSAAFLFGLGSVLSKKVGYANATDSIHPLQIVYARFFFALIFVSLIVLFKGYEFKRPNLKLHIARSACGWTGVAILFSGVIFIPASDAVAIIFLNPIFAMLLAIFVLKERLIINRWIATFISLLGMVVLLRPTLDFESNIFAYLCLAGAFIMGVEILFIKILTEREPFLQILFVNNFIATLIGVIPMIFFFKLPNFFQLIDLISIGAAMVLGQLFFLNAMKGTETTFIAPFFYSTLVFVMILDLVFFGVIPDSISLIGASLIIIGGLFISLKINFKAANKG